MPSSQVNAAYRTAVITGAAGGIGRALAHALAKQGHALVLADIDAAALAHVQTEIEAYGQPVASLRIDVADASQIEQLCAFSFGRLGHVDLLVNNAGVLPLPVEIWQALQLPLVGLLNSSRPRVSASVSVVLPAR